MHHPPVALTWQRLGPRPLATVSPAARPSPADAWAAAADRLAAVAAAAAAARAPALLVVNDPCRGTRTRDALDALASLAPRLAPRLTPPALDVVVACGTHRFPEAERRAFEQATFAGVGLPIRTVAWHDAADPALVPCGRLGARVHPLAAAAPAVIAVGSVEPHYFAGATGAHKTLTVGVLSRRDIERNHEGALSPASDVLRLDDNPVHRGIAALLADLYAGRPALALNEVVADGAVVTAAAGDPLEALEAVLPVAREVYLTDVQEPADLLHLRVPLPLGRSLYQADKALKNNHLAVRDGGGIILEAPCPDGVGQDAFLGLLRAAPTFAEARALVLRDGYRLGDHKAVKLRHLTDPAARGVRLALVAEGLPDEACALLGARRFATAEEAAAWLAEEIRATGPAPATAPAPTRAALIEDAGNVSAAPRGGR